MRRLALLVALAAGCGPEFDPKSVLSDLRVVAIKAEPPEIAPGETTTLTAVVPLEETRGGVSFEWAVCRLPPVAGASGGVNQDCLLHETAPFLEPAGTTKRVQVTMPDVEPLDLGLPDGTGGFYLPVRLVIRDGEQRVFAIYRLRYAITPKRNTNPVLTGLFAAPGGLDGGAVEEVPLPEDALFEVRATTLDVRARVSDDSVETYLTLVGDPRDMNFESTEELMRYHWYSEAGDISEPITGDDRPWVTIDYAKRPPATPGQPFDLWVVVHDSRGGIDYAHRRLILR